MVTIESTPEMAAKLYATMRQNLAVVRRRLRKPLTRSNARSQPWRRHRR